VVANSGDEHLRAQLYNLYGEGQISEDVFSALRSLADRGELRQSDLAVHRARARHRPTQHKDQELTNALQGVRSRMDQLVEARRGSASVLTDLDKRISEVEERIAAKESSARQAISEDDEDRARHRLAEKAELSVSRERLLAQAQALRDDLAQLADLHAQLEANEVELKAVRARRELADLASTQNGLEGRR
jgi:phage shock protein A